MPRWIPCRPYRSVSPGHYRNGMPGETAATPNRTTVTLSVPNRGRGRSEPERPEIESKTARARLGTAETVLLEERRLLTTAELAALAHQVRLAWCGPEVEVEGILSAKTGGCPEDCHFCSQSSRFDTPVKATPFLDADEVLAAAEETRAAGASEFCIVLAVRGPDERTMVRILELVPMIHGRTAHGQHDAEFGGSGRPGLLGGRQHLVGVEEWRGLDRGVEPRGLRAEVAVLGASAGLGRQDALDLDLGAAPGQPDLVRPRGRG